MTYWYTFIGDADDPKFQWEPSDEAYRIFNLPCAVLSEEQMEGLSVSASFMIDLIKEGGYDARQLDWGAWGVRLTGDQLRSFYATVLRCGDKLDALSGLKPDKLYVLMVVEGG